MPNYAPRLPSAGFSASNTEIAEEVDDARPALLAALRGAPESGDAEAETILLQIATAFVLARRLEDATPLLREAFDRLAAVKNAAERFVSTLDAPAGPSVSWTTLQHVDSLIREQYAPRFRSDERPVSFTELSVLMNGFLHACERAEISLTKERERGGLDVGRSWTQSLVRPLALYWHHVLGQPWPRFGKSIKGMRSFSPSPFLIFLLQVEGALVADRAGARPNNEDEEAAHRVAVWRALKGLQRDRNPWTGNASSVPRSEA